MIFFFKVTQTTNLLLYGYERRCVLVSNKDHPVGHSNTKKSIFVQPQCSPNLSSQSLSFSCFFIPFFQYLPLQHQWAPFPYTLDSCISSAKILPHSYCCRFSAFFPVFDSILLHVVLWFLYNTLGIYCSLL